MRRIAALVLVHVVWTAVASSAAQEQTRSNAVVPLLDDTRFERGFIVWSPSPGRHVREGTLRLSESAGDPVWGLAQWHSRKSLAGAPVEQLPDGARRVFDGAKALTFFPATGDADISFSLNGHTEYGGKSPEPGDPWPHLLAERSLLTHPAVTELGSLRFAISYRLLKAEIRRPPGFDLRRHTAQFLFYLTVQNRNQASPGYGDYFWFGVQMYDTRYPLPRPHMAVDKGSDRKPATGKFIFNPAGQRYTKQSAHDGDWVTIKKDLLPLIREGLETAWQRGYLRDSRDAADYRLGGMNMGWEVTGPINVEMQVKGLQLEANHSST